MTIRPMQEADADAVASLVHRSTNAWYREHRGFEIFTGPEEDCLLFPQVYGELDPGAGVVAEDDDGVLRGSCFLHPRPSHLAVGIVNTDPDAAGAGVAGLMMETAIRRADETGKPLRLVSSAMNLDSFSLYSRRGFRPLEFYQDMVVPVEKELPPEPLSDTGRVSAAEPGDAAEIAALEEEVSGISREADWRYFAENRRGMWSLLVHREVGGRIDGCLGSVLHPASHMLGPGVAREVGAAQALLEAQLRQHAGTRPVFLVPSRFPELVDFAYRLGARNCELHVLQVRGEGRRPEGITFPSFMPETG